MEEWLSRLSLSKEDDQKVLKHYYGALPNPLEIPSEVLSLAKYISFVFFFRFAPPFIQAYVG